MGVKVTSHLPEVSDRVSGTSHLPEVSDRVSGTAVPEGERCVY